ncbi:uncharacterized protein LOC144865844 [Branchiostoma floridae x Branchiostoma japonicum]
MSLRRSQRERRPSRKEGFQYDWSLPRGRPTPKSWSILEVLERIDQDRVLVRWNPTNGREWPDSPVDLRINPELRARLEKNGSNPKVKAFKDQQMAIEPRELGALRQLIYDNLGNRYTPSKEGHSRRVTVTLPFPESSFRRLFLQKLSIPICQELLEEQPLENCFGQRAISILPGETMEELDAILGESWGDRTFNTNTVCSVIKEEEILVSWGYKKRELFSHKNCPRCNWDKESGERRPEACTTTVSYLVGEAELSFTFSRRRGLWEPGMM